MVFALGDGGVFALEELVFPFLFLLVAFLGLYKKVDVLAILGGMGFVLVSFIYFSGILLILMVVLGLFFMIAGSGV